MNSRPTQTNFIDTGRRTPAAELLPPADPGSQGPDARQMLITYAMLGSAPDSHDAELPPTVPDPTPISEWDDAAVHQLYADLTCEPGQESFNKPPVSPTKRAEARRAGQPDPLAADLDRYGLHHTPPVESRTEAQRCEVQRRDLFTGRPFAASVDDRQRVRIEQDTPRMWEEADRESRASASMLVFGLGVVGFVLAGAVIVFWAVLAR